jgi:hypothetical protein
MHYLGRKGESRLPMVIFLSPTLHTITMIHNNMELRNRGYIGQTGNPTMKLPHHEEIRSLCKSLSYGENILRVIEAQVINQNGTGAVLDQYLRQLNAMVAFNTLFLVSEKPIRNEVPLRLHPDLRHMPQEAR